MRLRMAMVPILVALTLAGCGGSGGEDDGVATAGNGKQASASPTPSLDNEQRQQLFAQCMRDEGVEVEAQVESDGKKQSLRFRAPGEGGPEPAKVQAAMAKCKQFLPNGGEPPKLSAEELERSRQYSKCMRDNGVPNFPDPNENGGIMIGPEVGSPDDPGFKAAEETCRALAPDVGGGKVKEGEGPGFTTDGD